MLSWVYSVSQLPNLWLLTLHWYKQNGINLQLIPIYWRWTGLERVYIYNLSWVNHNIRPTSLLCILMYGLLQVSKYYRQFHVKQSVITTQRDSHTRNIIKHTNFAIFRLFFLSFFGETLPKCRTKLLQFMRCVLKKIRRRMAKILPCIYYHVFIQSYYNSYSS